MTPDDPHVALYAYFRGRVKVSGGGGLKVVEHGEPHPGSELEPPEALMRIVPGELTVIDDEPSGPLVLASHGRAANLSGRRKMIEAAKDSGRRVEIHVFERPDRGG